MDLIIYNKQNINALINVYYFENDLWNYDNYTVCNQVLTQVHGSFARKICIFSYLLDFCDLKGVWGWKISQDILIVNLIKMYPYLHVSALGYYAGPQLQKQLPPSSHNTAYCDFQFLICTPRWKDNSHPPTTSPLPFLISWVANKLLQLV